MTRLTAASITLWSVLFTTGYLTLGGKPERGVFRLKIPNEEVREVFRHQIQELFHHTVLQDVGEMPQNRCPALRIESRSRTFIFYNKHIKQHRQ